MLHRRCRQNLQGQGGIRVEPPGQVWTPPGSAELSFAACRISRASIFDVHVEQFDPFAKFGRQASIRSLLDALAFLVAELDKGAITGGGVTSRSSVAKFFVTVLVTFTDGRVCRSARSLLLAGGVVVGLLLARLARLLTLLSAAVVGLLLTGLLTLLTGLLARLLPLLASLLIHSWLLTVVGLGLLLGCFQSLQSLLQLLSRLLLMVTGLTWLPLLELLGCLLQLLGRLLQLILNRHRSIGLRLLQSCLSRLSGLL